MNDDSDFFLSKYIMMNFFCGEMKKRLYQFIWNASFCFREREERELVISIIYFSIKHNDNYSLNVNSSIFVLSPSSVNNKQWRIGMENHLTSDTWVK